jgi:hypothetical protein
VDNKQKNIIILSPEPWGKMLLSKMHYATELVKKGYKVYFVNPPRAEGQQALASVAEEREGGNLIIINTKVVGFSLFLRHKIPFLFRELSRRYIKAIQQITGKEIYQVWSFDPNLYVDLTLFGAESSISLLYDFYQGKHVWKAAGSADLIISVSQLILDFYQELAPPKLLVQHGLGKHFADRAQERLRNNNFETNQRNRIRVGYVGNLLRAGMNTTITRKVIEGHPGIEFHFWGPYTLENNNVTDPNTSLAPDMKAMIELLKDSSNVILHGVADQQSLAEGLFGMDMFLFLYSPRKEVNSASNSHKLLEYLSTGKVVVSTHVSNYAGTGLLEMCDKESEENLPAIFESVVGNIQKYNSEEQQRQRIAFALDNTYIRQVDRILQFAQKSKKH